MISCLFLAVVCVLARIDSYKFFYHFSCLMFIHIYNIEYQHLHFLLILFGAGK